jgi:hypothetical protein
MSRVELDSVRWLSLFVACTVLTECRSKSLDKKERE